MTDITGRARELLVDRAKDWCADAQVAHTYGVGIRADLSTIAMVRELVAEVERLRESPIRELHRPGLTGSPRNRLCGECMTQWPCATARLIYREDEL